MKLVTPLLTLSILTACATVPPPPPPRRPPMVAGVPVTERPKELGSLWSEDSRWNNVFDAAPYRAPGDTIQVTLTENFALRLAELKGKPLPKESAGGKGTSKLAKLDATIMEVMPRDVFKIWIPNARTDEKESGVMLSAMVKEKDITSGDSVPFDALFNTKLEVKPPEPKTMVDPKNAEAKSAPVQSASNEKGASTTEAPKP